MFSNQPLVLIFLPCKGAKVRDCIQSSPSLANIRGNLGLLRPSLIQLLSVEVCRQGAPLRTCVLSTCVHTRPSQHCWSYKPMDQVPYLSSPPLDDSLSTPLPSRPGKPINTLTSNISSLWHYFYPHIRGPQYGMEVLLPSSYLPYSSL